MKRLLLVAPILVVVSAGLAAAEDHLVCYKVRDPLRVRSVPPANWLDLTGPQFGSENCKVVGGFRLFCVPVDKTITASLERRIPPGSYQAFTPNPTPGLGEQDRLCYKLHCAGNAAPPSVLVEDQFGTRTITAPRPYLVCGPADKATTTTTGPPVPTTSTSSTTSTTSTTATTQPPCCTAGGFVSFTTDQSNFGADAGNVTRLDGTPLGTYPDLLLGGLYMGSGGNSAPLPHVLPDMSQFISQITTLVGCQGTLGPTTSLMTGSNRNCTAPGCLVGPPLPIPNSTVPVISMCLVSSLSGAGTTGTGDCCTGAIDINRSLSTNVYLVGDGDPAAGIQPCPICNGMCVGGANNNNPCTPATSPLNSSYPTSQDCPPSASNLVATIVTNQTLTTSAVSWTAAPPTNDDGSQTNQPRVFCGYCRDVDFSADFESPARQCWENGMAIGAPCGGVYETCEQRTSGAFGPNGGATRTITAFGAPSGGICNPAPARLASIFCVPPTFNATIDAGYDLPSPAASVVEVTTLFCPAANPCP